MEQLRAIQKEKIEYWASYIWHRIICNCLKSVSEFKKKMQFVLSCFVWFVPGTRWKRTINFYTSLSLSVCIQVVSWFHFSCDNGTNVVGEKSTEYFLNSEREITLKNVCFSVMWRCFKTHIDMENPSILVFFWRTVLYNNELTRSNPP